MVLMIWWLLVPAGAVVAKVIYDALTAKDKPHDNNLQWAPVTPRRFHFDVRGEFEGSSALVIGRTGAGKSSLINMIRGEQVLDVGAIGSTTRWIEGVPCQFGLRTLTLVDSPGVGEVYTDADYNSGIEDWFISNSDSVACIVLVLQADTKAHADDKRLLDTLLAHSRKSVIIALNQADKMTPIRETFSSDDWEVEKLSSSEKSKHIAQKIEHVQSQFGSSSNGIHIIPVASEPSAQFNRYGLIRTIQACV